MHACVFVCLCKYICMHTHICMRVHRYVCFLLSFAGCKTVHDINVFFRGRAYVSVCMGTYIYITHQTCMLYMHTHMNTRMYRHIVVHMDACTHTHGYTQHIRTGTNTHIKSIPHVQFRHKNHPIPHAISTQNFNNTLNSTYAQGYTCVYMEACSHTFMFPAHIAHQNVNTHPKHCFDAKH